MIDFFVAPQTWHWNEKRVIAQYYHDLAVRELAEESERKATIDAKLAELEEAILA
jgi:hypothetical protein